MCSSVINTIGNDLNEGVPAKLYVKIDRPSGVVSFQQPRSAEEVLSDWSSDLGKLLGILEATTHLIHRETMVHKL